jgi:preprotein translocase subunit SecG
MSLFISVFTVILVFVSVILVFLVLMQRAKSDGGMGAAMGGGATESAFGAETTNVLSGATIKGAIVFFVLSFALYVANIYQAKHHDASDSKLPTVIAPAVVPQSAPAAPLTTPGVQPATKPPGDAKKP